MFPLEKAVMEPQMIEILKNDNRRLIFERISIMPGITLSELQRSLQLQTGVVSYHLYKLEKGKLIKTSHEGIHKRCYPIDHKVQPSMFLNYLQMNILNIINNRPGITQVKLSEVIGKSKIVIHYHVRLLADAGLISTYKEGRECRCYSRDIDKY